MGMSSKQGREGFILWDTCRGRNGADIPARVPDDQACEAINVYFPRDGLGRRRNGSSLIAIDPTSAAYLGVNAFGYFQPVQPTGLQPPTLFIVSRDAPPKLIGFNTVWWGMQFGMPDVNERPVESIFVQFNNKLFFAYDSSVNRLHVIDGPTVRRAGLASQVAPPTVANTAAAGTYPNTPRWYRIRWQTRYGGTLAYQSNSSDPAAFAPDGAHQGVVVTRPAPPGESENFWQVEASASSSDGPFYDIGAPIPITTTTYTDTQVPATYDDGDAAPEAGANTPWPSVKFLLSTGTRLLGFGVWESSDTGNTGAMTPVMGRVYFSPVVNTTDSQDEERVSFTTTVQGYIDIARPGGQEDRALAGPLNDAVLVFQSFGIWQLYPTENAVQPYRRVQLDPALGAVNQQTTFMGHDQNGNPVCYFVDPERGPCRYGTEGFEYLAYDISDVWETFNKAASVKSAHGAYYKEAGLVMFWIATGTDTEPSTILVFDISLGRPVGNHEVRGGWSVYTGAVAKSRCSIVRTFAGSPLMGVAMPSGIVVVDDPAAVVDYDGSRFHRRLTSKAWGTSPVVQNKAFRGGAWIQAEANAGQNILLAFLSNYGQYTPLIGQSLALTPTEGSATRVLRKYDDAILSDWFAVQIDMIDAEATLPSEVDFFFTLFEAVDEHGNQ